MHAYKTKKATHGKGQRNGLSLNLARPIMFMCGV